MTSTAPRHRRTELLTRLRAFVPDGVASALSNCGGVNRDGRRFAAHLLDPDLTDDEYLAICHALIFPNGVRKTTKYQRNVDVLHEVGGRKLLPESEHIRVLDVGASIGLDGLATYSLLKEKQSVDEYRLGDLHTELLYDRERGLIFDEDGRLLQIQRGSSFVSINFSYNFPFQRIASLPKRLQPWLLGRHVRFGSDQMTRIPLVHPKLHVGSPTSPFRLQRMDVFSPVAESFDLIICMHLLVPRYFGEQAIEAGMRNLSSALREGGTLIAGATERYRVVRRLSGERFETHEIRSAP